MYIGGAGVARGYLNRPELTAERFLTDPFSPEPNARMYRTGDLARYLPDGNIEFLGRNDSQVKLRGFRIELGEIEARLMEHPHVRDAVVIAREDTPGDKRLIAYYTTKEENLTPDAEHLRSHLSASLPAYMVPAAYVLLPALPLTPNGKLDRNALPAPEGEAFATRGYEAPQGEIETTLAAIWAEVLKIDQVGRYDNFFNLGGHSLLAVRMATRLRQELSLEVDLRDLFAHPTLADLARTLESAAHTELPPIAPVDRNGQLPLSFAQQRLWFLDQLEPGSSAYNMPFGLRLKGELKRKALEKGLNQLVKRHEALRTSFGMRDGNPVQVIVAELELNIEEIDLRGVAEGRLESEVVKYAKAEAAQSFDLVRGPLLRVKLLQLGEQEHVLLLTMHHIVTDGWSMGVVVREIAKLYEAQLKNEEGGLPELAVQYADYAVWQRARLQGEVMEQQIDYWRKQLAGVPVLDVPTDYVRGAVESQAGATIEWSLPEEMGRQLKELSRKEGVTLFMALLAGFQLLLSRYTGQQDIAVGSPIAGRTRTDTDNLIGFFVNTLVLRSRMSGTMSFRALLAQVREKTLEAYEHQEVPFEKLVEELRPERDLSRPPLFQVMFSFLNMPFNELELPGLKISGLSVPMVMEKFEMSLFAGEQQGRVQGSLSYRTNLFAESSMRRLLGHFENLLREVVSAPQRAIGELVLLSEVEREQMLVEWNRTAVEHPQQSIQELFEEQVKRTPQAVAVASAGREMSYAELNRTANQLAHYLRRHGVGREVWVGAYLERDLELVAALLGVLKAGGVYVPLEPPSSGVCTENPANILPR